MRRWRRDNVSIDAIYARSQHKEFIRHKGTPNQRKKLEENELIESRAMELFDRYKVAGITWSACMQAVKTNYIGQLTIKWSKRLTEYRRETKENTIQNW